MKNLKKLIGIIIFVMLIGFSMTGCSEETYDNEEEWSTNTQLTITGLNSLEGQKIVTWSTYYGTNPNLIPNLIPQIVGCARATKYEYFDGTESGGGSLRVYPATVTSGQVILKLFYYEGGVWGNPYMILPNAMHVYSTTERFINGGRPAGQPIGLFVNESSGWTYQPR